jgi:pSer/pThr/pTyr-binding forkhead associated (FHA) protein
VPDSLLKILNLALVILLWLFFLRVLRAVWAELKAPPVAAVAPVAPAPAPARPTPAAAPPRPAASPSPSRPITGDGGAAQLVIVESPEQRGQAFPLADELTVGRGGGCAVALRDRMVSQLHARIFRRDGQLFVEDLGSTNGTLLNGKKVSAAVAMRKGDRLQVGKTVLEVSGPGRGAS